ncbi:MAG: hypothetical protein ACK5LU_01015, partial [Pseudanabaena sp.]
MLTSLILGQNKSSTKASIKPQLFSILGLTHWVDVVGGGAPPPKKKTKKKNYVFGFDKKKK